MFTDVVILAGGFGERLWPASSPTHPKQFMAISDGFSFFQSAVIRALAIKPSGNILIITRKDLIEGVSRHCTTLYPHMDEYGRAKIKNDLYIIPETYPRHTTAPIIIACHFLDKMFPDKKHAILVLTSDHVISTTEQFISDTKKAAHEAEEGMFVCYAIPPTEAATEYGYIQAGASISKDGSVFNIKHYHEKPDKKTAKSYVEAGNFWWNSGMFGFTSATLKQELLKCQPDIYTAFERVPESGDPIEGFYGGIKYIKSWQAMDEAYALSPAIAIDKSIAEKTDCACAVRATFSWDDIGSWDAFERLCTTKNYKTLEINSENNFVYSDLPVALCGVNDLIVVVKNGSVLVTKKGSSSMVRDVAKHMSFTRPDQNGV